MKKATTLLFILFTAYNVLAQASFQETFGASKVSFKNNTLKVSTGKFEKTWTVTPYGLATTSIKNSNTKKEWVNTTPSNCDWAYYGLIENTTKAKLINITAKKDNDQGFTSDHILVEAEFEYPEVETFLKYYIWVYPNAPGVRTQLSLKGKSKKYIKNPISSKGIKFSLVDGKNKYDYQAHGYSNAQIANYAIGDKKIEYLISGLDKNKSYKVGISWWDFEGKGITQKVITTSVGGETVSQVLEPKTLPDHKNKQQKPEELIFDLPNKVLLDGSFRLIAEKLAGENAILSEIWVMEQSDDRYSIKGNVDRVEMFKNQMDHGWVLAGYVNCGEKHAAEEAQVSGRVDFLPINAQKMTRKYVGHYNDTQHRNKAKTPLLREERFNNPFEEKENIAWASIFVLEDKENALLQVKESHKCVNQYGHDTGDFRLSENGIENTGTSLMPDEILDSRYRKAWASWLICSEQGQDATEFALKAFDRFRYPVDPSRDIYIQANTWGSGRNKEAAREENILKEIEVQSELGIDIQQIDDGWQTKAWRPKENWYPQDWENVKAKAKEHQVKLGLWAAAMPVSLEDLKWNYDNGGFISYKLDFANLSNHENIESMMDKIRGFVSYTNHKVRVNWDVTENAPRYGYFWAREYGSVYLENRKPMAPENVVYHPYLVLRDLWHLSKYCNLNKFQGTVQNKDMVNKEVSDAYKHSHQYTTAIPLMSTPLFFQETQFYSQQAKEEIKEVLTAYKKERGNIYECYVYPVGEEPNNDNWSGFQAHHPNKNIGYLNLFREINNNESHKNIQLRFLKNKTITFTNLMTNQSFKVKVDENGYSEFNIKSSGNFMLLKYSY